MKISLTPHPQQEGALRERLDDREQLGKNQEVLENPIIDEREELQTKIDRSRPSLIRTVRRGRPRKQFHYVNFETVNDDQQPDTEDDENDTEIAGITAKIS